MSKTIQDILTLIALIVLLATALYVLPEMKCRQIAEAMQRTYIYDGFNGCYVQTVDGNWQRIDQNNNYQP